MAEDLDKFMGSIGATPETMKATTHPEAGQAGFGAGLAQAALGPPEAISQLAEKGIDVFKPGFRFPWSQKAEEYRQYAEGTGMGRAGELVGSLGMFALPFLGELGWLARGARGLEGLSGAIQGGRAGLAADELPSLNAMRAATAGRAAAAPATEAEIAAATRPTTANRPGPWYTSPTAKFAAKSGVAADLAQPQDPNSNYLAGLGSHFALGATLGALAARAGALPELEATFLRPKGPATRGAGGRFQAGERGPGEWEPRRTPEAQRQTNADMARVRRGERADAQYARVGEDVGRFIGHEGGRLTGMPMPLRYLIAQWLGRAGRGGAGAVRRGYRGTVGRMTPGTAGALGAQGPSIGDEESD